MTEEQNTDARGGAEDAATGLAWPKSWKGAYAFVLGSFCFWLILLIALTEFFS